MIICCRYKDAGYMICVWWDIETLYLVRFEADMLNTKVAYRKTNPVWYGSDRV